MIALQHTPFYGISINKSLQDVGFYRLHSCSATAVFWGSLPHPAPDSLRSGWTAAITAWVPRSRTAPATSRWTRGTHLSPCVTVLPPVFTVYSFRPPSPYPAHRRKPFPFLSSYVCRTCSWFYTMKAVLMSSTLRRVTDFGEGNRLYFCHSNFVQLHLLNTFALVIWK